jgi:hypothetical protein
MFSRILSFLREFQGYPAHTQRILGALAIAGIAALTTILVMLALHPAGVGAVLAFLSGLVALFLAKNRRMALDC